MKKCKKIYAAVGARRKIELVEYNQPNGTSKYSGSINGRGLRFGGWITDKNPAIQLSYLLREFRYHNPRAAVYVIDCDNELLYNSWAEVAVKLKSFSTPEPTEKTIIFIEFFGKRYYVNSTQNMENLKDLGFCFVFGNGEHSKNMMLRGDEGFPFKLEKE